MYFYFILIALFLLNLSFFFYILPIESNSVPIYLTICFFDYKRQSVPWSNKIHAVFALIRFLLLLFFWFAMGRSSIALVRNRFFFLLSISYFCPFSDGDCDENRRGIHDLERVGCARTLVFVVGKNDSFRLFVETIFFFECINSCTQHIHSMHFFHYLYARYHKTLYFFCIAQPIALDFEHEMNSKSCNRTLDSGVRCRHECIGVECCAHSIQCYNLKMVYFFNAFYYWLWMHFFFFFYLFRPFVSFVCNEFKLSGKNLFSSAEAKVVSRLREL